MTGPSFRAWFAVAALTVLSMGACAREQEPETGSGTNTNWLKRCGPDQGCEAGAECLCGVCTVGCVDDTGCLLPGTRCSLAGSRIRCAALDALPVCLDGCENDSGCPAGERCDQGTCVLPLPLQRCVGELSCSELDDATELESFEPILTFGNAVSLTSDSVSGSGAIQATTIAEGPSVAYLRKSIPTATSGQLHARFWVNVPKVNGAVDVAPFGFWSDQDADWALRVTVRYGKLGVWSYTTPRIPEETTEFTLGDWHCVQFAVTLNDTAGIVEVTLDGEPAGKGMTDTLPLGGIQRFMVGNVWSPTPAQVLVDRVAVGTTPIGCFE